MYRQGAGVWTLAARPQTPFHPSPCEACKRQRIKCIVLCLHKQTKNWVFHSAARPYCPLASFCHAGCVGFRCCLVVLWSKMLFRLWPKSLQASKQQLNAHSSALGGPDTEPITGCFSSLWPQLVSRSIGKSRQQSGHRPKRRSSLCRLLSYKVNRFTRYARRLHTLSSWLTSASALVARDRCVRRP